MAKNKNEKIIWLKEDNSGKVVIILGRRACVYDSAGYSSLEEILKGGYLEAVFTLTEARKMQRAFKNRPDMDALRAAVDDAQEALDEAQDALDDTDNALEVVLKSTRECNSFRGYVCADGTGSVGCTNVSEEEVDAVCAALEG